MLSDVATEDDPGPDVHLVPFAEALLRGAQNHSDRDFIVLTDERATYGDLAARSQRVARSFLALGVERGDRVGILMANCLDFLEVLFGASLIGAVPVLYNARFKAREIAHVTTDAAVKVVVTNGIIEEHTDYVDLLGRAVPDLAARTDLDAVFLGAGNRDGFLGRAEFEALAETVDQNVVDSRHDATEVDDVAIMFYTSGTTAMPKGCPLTHVQLQHAGVVGGVTRLGLVAGEVLWGPLPMFHTAFSQPLCGILHVGGTFVSMTYFDAGKALDLIEREKVTVIFPAFPTITMQLLNHEKYREASFANVRVNFNVGPGDVLQVIQSRMPSTKVVTAFGMTETGGSVVMCEPGESLEHRTQSSGKALPGFEVRVGDPESSETVSAGQRGEVLVRGRGVFSGYHNDPVKTAEAFTSNGWFRTGDLGSMSADDRLTFHGRLKDMLKVGGENVACVEIEGYLATHPAVNLAQVVGLPDEKYDEVPVAFVELHAGVTATESEIIDFCRGEIASFKIPRHVRFVETWPMGATKILKYELRHLLDAEFGLT